METLGLALFTVTVDRLMELVVARRATSMWLHSKLSFSVEQF